MTTERTANRAGHAPAWFAALCSALALAGCLEKPPSPPVAVAPVTLPAPIVEEPPAPPRPARKPAPPSVAALPPQAEPQAEPQAASLGPALDDKGFARVQGLDTTEAMAMLGEPQQRAEAPPAVLWRYARNDCELDLYFYLDLQSRQMRVLHYEVRDTDGNDRSQQRCYGELVPNRPAN